MPIVSVIIPAYNRFSTIARSMASVLAQSFQDFEIIVVDDGSNDQTCEVVRGFFDKRIRLICHDSNLGAGAARNTGMKLAIGKYIAWLDSDDEWLPEKLNIQVKAFDHSLPDQKACYSAYERVELDRSRVYVPQYVDYKRLFLGCDQAPGSTLIFERNLLNEIGYIDASLRRYEDWDWLLRYCSKYRLLAVEIPLARVHYTPQRSPIVVESSALHFVSKYSDELKQFGVYRNVVLSRRWMEVASYYAQEHNIRKIAEYLVKTLTMFPFQPVDVWAWLINNWFGIKIGLIFSREKTKNEKR